MSDKAKYDAENAMSIILDKFPEYKQRRLEYLSNWGDEKCPLGLEVNDFKRFVVNGIEKGVLSELPKVFDLVEEFITMGDEVVSQAGLEFLDDIINTSSNRPDEVPFDTYIHLLGPRSKKFCRQLDEFWGVKTPGLW